MKFRIISDLHTEFWGDNGSKKLSRILDFVLPPLDTDKDSILLVAGDTFTYSARHKVEPLMNHLDSRFLEVVAVQGNHEPYGASIEEGEGFFREWGVSTEFNQVFGGVRVAGATLWTDFNKADPISMYNALGGMNDYKSIKNFRPEDSLDRHREAMKYLENHVKEGGVVMTHHAPSFKSIHSKYASGDNSSYFSDLEEFILRKKPALWVHGHVHNCFDYTIGETRVVCNPVGYRGYEVTGYRKNLVIEI